MNALATLYGNGIDEPVQFTASGPSLLAMARGFTGTLATLHEKPVTRTPGETCMFRDRLSVEYQIGEDLLVVVVWKADE